MIFLGGTCNGSTWREDLIPALEECGLDYFNPVVDDWTTEAQMREEAIKLDPRNVELYCITKEMKGVFSIAEAVQASNKKPTKTIFWFDSYNIPQFQVKSLEQVGKLIQTNGGMFMKNFYNIPAACMVCEKNLPQFRGVTDR